MLTRGSVPVRARGVLRKESMPECVAEEVWNPSAEYPRFTGNSDLRWVSPGPRRAERRSDGQQVGESCTASCQKLRTHEEAWAGKRKPVQRLPGGRKAPRKAALKRPKKS